MSSDRDAALVAQNQEAYAAVDAIRARELRMLTDADALLAAQQPLELVSVVEPKRSPCGLVEQQRLFGRASP